MHIVGNPDDLKYWVAFNRIPRIGRVRFKLIEERFGTLEQAWRAGLTELRAAGLDDRTAQHIATRKLQIDPDEEMGHLQDFGARAITWHDDEYPVRLKEIYDLPPIPVRPGQAHPRRRALCRHSGHPEAHGIRA